MTNIPNYTLYSDATQYHRPFYQTVYPDYHLNSNQPQPNFISGLRLRHCHSDYHPPKTDIVWPTIWSNMSHFPWSEYPLKSRCFYRSLYNCTKAKFIWNPSIRLERQGICSYSKWISVLDSVFCLSSQHKIVGIHSDLLICPFSFASLWWYTEFLSENTVLDSLFSRF